MHLLFQVISSNAPSVHPLSLYRLSDTMAEVKEWLCQVSSQCVPPICPDISVCNNCWATTLRVRQFNDDM